MVLEPLCKFPAIVVALPGQIDLKEEAAEGHRTALKRAKTSPEICPTSNPALTGRVRSGTKDHRSTVFLLCKWLRFG
jgi:hypothetical protein